MTSPPLHVPESAFLVFFVQLCLGGCLLFSLAYGVAGLTLFCLLLLAMGTVAELWSRAAAMGIECRIDVDRTRLFPGERLQVGIQAANAKWLPVLLKVDLFADRNLTGSDSDNWVQEEFGLLWYQRSALTRDFFPARRGVYGLGPPMIHGGDLFGFRFRPAAQAEPIEVVVYPRLLPIRPLALPRREFFGVPGARSPVEDPIYIFGTRDYHGARPARAIHWKASARHDRLQEKVCEPAEQSKVLLLVDVDRFADDPAQEAFERTLSAVASLAVRFDRRGVAMGLAANGRIRGAGSRVIPVARRPQQIVSILETLAGMEALRVASLAAILSHSGAMRSWGLTVVCFAHRDSRDTPAARDFLRRRRVPARFVLTAGVEDRAADLQNPDSLDLEDLVFTGDRPC